MPTTTAARVWRDKGDRDRAIADFNEAIRLDPDPKDARAYNNRGLAWRNKGDLDRAIADYSEAIRLDPKYAFAYNNRGFAWRDKDDLDRAIADYTEALRLEPKNAAYYRNRGYAYFHKGDFTASTADLLRATDLADNAYGMLFRYLARVRLKQDGAAELSASAARLKSKDWPYAVIDFYLGLRSLAEMRAAANRPQETCEAESTPGRGICCAAAMPKPERRYRSRRIRARRPMSNTPPRSPSSSGSSRSA